MEGGKLSNDEENRVQYKGSYNLGKITGIDNGSNNIGGMIGKAVNATVGGTKNTLINYNTVEGGYNVGGIVGSVENTTVANASNEGVVKANGYTFDSIFIIQIRAIGRIMTVPLPALIRLRYLQPTSAALWAAVLAAS